MPQPGADDLHHHRQHRNNDDTVDDEAEIGAHPGQIAQKEARRHQAAHPQNTAQHIEGKELTRAHEGHAGHKGRKGAHDGHETGQHNGLAAMTLVKGMGLEQMFLLDEAGIAGKDGRPHVAADGVVGGIAQNAGSQHDAHDQGIAHVPGAGHHAGGKEQRVSGQKGRHHQAGLAEDDDKEDDVDPGAVIRHQFEQVGVNVQDEVHKRGKQFHDRPLVSEIVTGNPAHNALVPQPALWHNREHICEDPFMPYPLLRPALPLRHVLLPFLLVATLLLTLPSATHAEGTYRVGMRTLGYWLPEQNVRLDVNVWYPTNWTPRQLHYAPWRLQAAPNSTPAPGRFPLILLSHPSAGTRFSYHDTGTWLAEHGFVVAAPTHARDCMRNMDLLHTWEQFSSRVHELRSLLDRLLQHEQLGACIDPQRVGILGFGAGGTTGLLMGGALPDCGPLDAHCQEAGIQDDYCNVWSRRQLDKLCAHLPLTASLADTRIRVVAAVNPSHAMLFPPSALRYFYPRLLLVSAGLHDDGDSRLTTQLARNFATPPQYLRLPHADQGAFMAPCPPALSEELPELCRSVTAQERLREQENLRQGLLSFFLQWLGESGTVPAIPAPPELAPPPPPAKTPASEAPRRQRR